jgi:glutamine amidotransferase
MCRLFGQHAHAGLDPSIPLCTEHNGLRFQSHKHPHGWGVAWYEDGRPVLRRGLLPAHQDEAFVEAARAARSTVVVAHVRDASVGPVSEENTHPFRLGRWLLAHNGTVARYKSNPRVRDALLAEIDRDLRGELRGVTDSERCFLVFLSRLRARGPLDGAALGDVRRALAETTETVTRIADPRARKRSTLNLLVSDGRILAASRHGKTLHLSTDAGPRHSFVVASERIGAGPWEEVPEGGFVGTEDGRTVVRDTIQPDPARRYSSPATGKSRG